MRCRKRYFLIVVIISSLGCGSSDNQINLFFNPSSAFDLDKIPVKVKINDDIILDTLIENRHVDESLLIKKISYRPIKNMLLHVEINGKKKDITGTRGLSKCTDVFLEYDDHSIIFEEVMKIERERAIQDISSDFKQLFDSIKATSSNKYHQTTFYIKEGKCNNK